MLLWSVRTEATATARRATACATRSSRASPAKSSSAPRVVRTAGPLMNSGRRRSVVDTSARRCGKRPDLGSVNSMAAHAGVAYLMICGTPTTRVADPGYEGYACDLDVRQGDDRRTVGGTDEIAHCIVDVLLLAMGQFLMFWGAGPSLLKPTDTAQSYKRDWGYYGRCMVKGMVFPEPIKLDLYLQDTLFSHGTLTSIQFLRDGDIPPCGSTLVN